jgi:hypothetical protein
MSLKLKIGYGVLILSFFTISFNANAKTTYELYSDCSNHCTFRDFENNCHGIAFKTNRKGEADIHYTAYSRILDSCYIARPPYFKTIKMSEVRKACPCNDLPAIPRLPAFNTPMSENSRNELVALKEQISNWAPCATDPMKINPVSEDGRFSPADQGVCKNMSNGYLVLGGCEPGMNSRFCVFYGNTNNVAAPYCLAGDLDRCKDIALAQDPKTGAWYRNAYQRRDPLSERGQPLFSRDEFLGIMIYLAKTKDQESARKWMQFVERNPKKYMTGLKRDLKFKVYNICPSLGVDQKPDSITDEQWENMKADDRCEMRPHDWAAMYATYKYIGISDEELKSISQGIYARMIATKPIMAITSLVSSATVPERSYQLALQATMILLYREIGYKGNQLLDASARLINERTAKDNPYYHYLAMGNRATEYGAALIKKFCASEKPNYLHPPQGGLGTPSAAFFDSANHTFGGLNNGYEANLPIGHDCIGWINFYLNAPSSLN